MDPEPQTAEEARAEACLSELAIAPESAALKELYDLYHRQLFGLIFAVLKDQSSAEEVLQDVFLKVIRVADTYDRRRGRPFSWLATLARRAALDRLRQRQRRMRLMLKAREQGQFDGDPIETHSHGFMFHQEDFLEEPFSQLSGSQREALRLAYFEGYSHREISQQLERPLGSVKADIRRALITLRDLFSKDDAGR
jgi:RNA polymerase sigma-70 factor (ECF subfamily)